MATTAGCYPDQGSGIKNLTGCLLNRHTKKSVRPSKVFFIPDYVQRPFCCFRNSLKRCTGMQSRELRSAGEFAPRGTLQKCRAEYTVLTHADEGEKEEDITRATLIWRAIKLPMYSVALIPLTVGTAVAYWQTGQVFLKRYFMLLAASVLAVAWINLSNDVYDFDTGADKNKKESVVNLVGSRTGIHIVAWTALVLGYIGLNWVSLDAGSLHSMPFFFSAVFCGYIYQCPPYRLSYQGLGEPIVFAVFGPFITTGYYLLQRSTRELPITSTLVAASVLVGFTTSLILFCSHFHQIEDDRAVGKISPLVRLGSESGAKVVKMAVVLLYSLLFNLGIFKVIPLACVILCGLTLPVGNLVVSFVQDNHKDKTKIFMSKYYCVRLHTIFGFALAIGLVVARMFASNFSFG